jgi:dTDP-glucose pyrophosphorylase
MQALILAGGRGKRLGGASAAANKCLLNVLGRPLIEYSLEIAINSGIKDIVVVVGYRSEDIINNYGDSYKGSRIEYVTQAEQKGLIHAMECAKNSINDGSFMLLLGDEFMVNPRHKEMLGRFENKGLFGICGIVLVEDKDLIKRTYAVYENKDNAIYRLVEKPENPLNNKMGTGNCIFNSKVFSFIENVPVNKKRGEKELPDLIQCAIDDGKRVEAFEICEHYININSSEEFKKAESYFAHL